MSLKELQLPEVVVSREIRGKTFTFRTGKLARQADGAVLASIGKTQVLGTAVMSHDEPDQDFFPLSVHYIEKFYAGGKIPGGYFKREAKPSDNEVLVSRLIDRPLRPLFPEGFRYEVQVIPTVFSIDKINPSDIVGMNAASAALVVSNIPFLGPIGAVRVGRVKGEWVVNPTYEEMAKSSLQLVVAGTKKAITMIEGEAHEISEEDMLQAISLAHEVIKEIIELQLELAQKAGKPKFQPKLFAFDADLKKRIFDATFETLKAASRNSDKLARETAVKSVKEKAASDFKAKEDASLHGQIGALLDQLEEKIVRDAILHDTYRMDGRALDEIRPIRCEVDTLDNVHGSALFTRGQTQVLAIATLGSGKDMLWLEETAGENKKHFFLHYNFPPYSVGETGRIGATGRREIGHGMLAERSLGMMMPSDAEFPFTTRVVSEVLESNGSSSMGTICSGSMALMAAGVPLKKPVAGIAMGLIMEGETYQVLTDIQGLEDHLGDMDFKVAGTEDGITGFQLDIKIEGITLEIMKKAMAQARQARLQILGAMKGAIATPRTEMNPNVPRLGTATIPVDKIRNVIGPGGKNIKALTAATGSDVEIDDNGGVKIFSPTKEALERTLRLLEQYTGIPKVGDVYEGTVRRLAAFGAFIEIMPGTDGLCHISELADRRVAQVSDVINEGDVVKVKVIAVDESGRVKLSMKQAVAG